jgi:Myotubularin-like phosphatase domain
MSAAGDDPLSAALAEAETLMYSLDVDDLPGSFVIDEEEEEEIAFPDSTTTPTDPLFTTTTSADAPTTTNFHPLYDNFSTANNVPASNMMHSRTAQGPGSGMVYQHQLQQMPASSGNILSSSPVQQQRQPLSVATGSPTRQHQHQHQHQQHQQHQPTLMQHHHQPHFNDAASQFISTTSVNMDAFKASTSKFASNLASMAQRAVALPPTTTAAPPLQQQQHSSFRLSNPNNLNMLMQPSSTLLSTTSNGGVPEPLQLQQQQQQVPPEMDAEQKTALIQSHFGELLPGERILMFLANLVHVSDSTTAVLLDGPGGGGGWCCVVTYYRLILFAITTPTKNTSSTSSFPPLPDGWHKSCWPPSPPTKLELPLACMERVEKSVLPSTANTTTTTVGLLCLTVTSKMGGHYVRFGSAAYADTNRVYDSLMNYAFPGRRNLGYLFAFESKREDVMASLEVTETGEKRVTLPPWEKRFDANVEYQRQFERGAAHHPTTGTATRTTSNHHHQAPWCVWQSVNSQYGLCASYPALMAGPTTLDVSQYPDAITLIRQCAAFRSEQRLPALTWSGRGGASIWRCSQPKVGLQGNRSTADELFFKHILERSAAATALDPPAALPPRSVLMQLTGTADLSAWLPQHTTSLKILDLRPRSSAMANRTAGYGYENTSNYIGCSLQFCGVGNIHAVRDAYQKLSNVCLSPNQSDLSFTSAVEDSKWLAMVRLIWSAAWETAYWVHLCRIPVVLHCSHGWDRTSQAGALAQLLLDSYYRTKKGFACLVEKDFMSFGHPFHLRCGHGESAANNTAGDEGQNSPIFLQFLDCVYQIVNLVPEAFEYNSQYLLEIADNLYSCRFGNFLCDTEREREVAAGLRQRTHSIWDHLDASETYTNQNFDADDGVLLVPMPTLIRSIGLWTDLFCRYGAKATGRW